MNKFGYSQSKLPNHGKQDGQETKCVGNGAQFKLEGRKAINNMQKTENGSRKKRLTISNFKEFSPITSSNRFSLLECDDVEEKDVDDKEEYIESNSEKIQNGNGLKKNRNKIKKVKKQKRIRKTKMAKSSQKYNQPSTATWARCRQCFRKQFPRRKFCRMNTLKKQYCPYCVHLTPLGIWSHIFYFKLGD